MGHTAAKKGALNLASALQQYAREHHNPLNRLLHHIGIPLVAVGFLIFLSFISITFAARWHISFAWLTTIVISIYYIRLHTSLGSLTAFLLLVTTALCSLAYPAPTEFSGWFLLICLVVGVLCLSLGHWFEKAKPQSWKHAQQTWVAPLFSVLCLVDALKIAPFLGLDPLCATLKDPHP